MQDAHKLVQRAFIELKSGKNARAQAHLEKAVKALLAAATEEEAAVAKVFRLTGQRSASAAFDEIEAWRASHIELESERRKLAYEQAMIESAERRRLCSALVDIGAAKTSHVWLDSNTLRPFYRHMQIDALREYVAEQRRARRR